MKGLKRFIVLAVVMMVAFSLFATSYKISNYEIEVQGKTHSSRIRKLIVPEGEEIFGSTDELISALNKKKQTLDNLRLFKDVSYSYTEEAREAEDVVDVNVKYTVLDSRTFLAIPYPKYDTNYGTRLGLRLRDTNLLGTFASLDGTLHLTFPDGNWSNPAFYGILELSQLTVGQTSISFNVDADATVKEGFSRVKFGTSVSHIPLFFGTWFDISADVKQTRTTKDKFNTELNLSTSIGGIKVGSIGLSPSLTVKVANTEVNKQDYTVGLGISNINLGFAGLGLSESLDIVSAVTEEVRETKINKYSQTLTLSFKHEPLNKISYTNGFVYYPQEKADNATKYEVNNTVNYYISGSTTLIGEENLKITTLGKVSSFDTGAGISQRIEIGSAFTITPTLKEYVRTVVSEDGFDFQPHYSLSASASRDTINWHGNFRDGMKYSLTISETGEVGYSGSSSISNSVAIYDHLEITMFKIFGSWFNPHARLIVNYSNMSGYQYAHGSSSSPILAEEMRGIRNTDINSANLLTVLANINLMAKFPMPSFFDFVDCYVNLFADCAITKNLSATPEKHLGFGVEGIGVLKDYPSYPVRVSLGFDAKKLIKWLKKEGSKDFYEIYIGLGFFL